MNSLVLVVFYLFMTFSFAGCMQGIMTSDMSMLAVGWVCFFLMCLTSTFYISPEDKDG